MSVSFSGSRALAVGSSVYVINDGDQWDRATVLSLTVPASTVRVTYEEGNEASVSHSCIVKRDARVDLTHADGEDRDFNLSNVNAAAFLRLLGLPCDAEDGLIGAASTRDVLIAVQRARASFDYRVDAVTRPTVEGVGAKGCRFISQGVDEAYFIRRLEEFAEYVTDLALEGAEEITWG